MKFVNLILVPLMLVAGVAFANEKGIDNQNAVSNAANRGVISGTLDENSPTYDRVFTGMLSLDCFSNVEDSSNDGTYFEIICFEVSDSEPIEMIANPALTTIGDTFFTIYCNPFDLGSPELNVVYTDDDDGEGLLSAFTVNDGLTLTVGNIYFLVVSTYGAGEVGDFSINTSTNIVECGTVATDFGNWDNLKANYR
ncbi:MAG: hypothetical protein GY780_05195 [bacterium]|nr:hypothetical protein [bacterium]